MEPGGSRQEGGGEEGIGLDTQGPCLCVEADGIQSSVVRGSSLLLPPLLTNSLPSLKLTSNIQDDELVWWSLVSIQPPHVLPCVNVLHVCDHQVGLASLNLKLPGIIKVVSWRLCVKDGTGLSIGSQPNGDISEGVGDVTGHHHAVASGCRHF